jgi:hypothetical protein
MRFLLSVAEYVFLDGLIYFLSTSVENSQSIILKLPKPISISLKEFSFAIVAFGSSVCDFWAEVI